MRAETAYCSKGDGRTDSTPSRTVCWTRERRPSPSTTGATPREEVTTDRGTSCRWSSASHREWHQLKLGIASAVLNAAQQVGGTLGLAILVTIAADATKTALASAASALGAPETRYLALTASLHGYEAAFAVGTCIAVAAFLVALVAIHPTTPAGSHASVSINGDGITNPAGPSMGDLAS